jgi:hypothetical protein
MNKVIFRLALICFLGTALPCEAQIWPFKKRSQSEKASKDLEARRKQAGEGNFFNRLQPVGSRINEIRDDYIWAAATAATSYHYAGNASITSPSRYGLSQGLELQSWLGLAYWAPNLFVKREIIRGKTYWVSSLHGAYTSWPGLYHVSKGSDSFLADSLSGVARVLSLKNQLLVSRPFYSTIDCNPNHPFLVVSAALSVDYGLAINKEEVFIGEQHFLTPRSASYAGKGWLATLALRGDWQMQSFLIGRAEIRALMGDFSSDVAFEQQTSVEYFPLSNFSISGGYLVGMANLGSGKFGFWPFVDISFYFGSKQGRKRGLFGQQMF